MLYCYAKLSDAQLAKIKAFEQEHKKKVLVLRPVDVEAETLSKQELSQLQALEKEFGFVLIAVK